MDVETHTYQILSIAVGSRFTILPRIIFAIRRRMYAVPVGSSGCTGVRRVVSLIRSVGLWAEARIAMRPGGRDRGI